MIAFRSSPTRRRYLKELRVCQRERRREFVCALSPVLGFRPARRRFSDESNARPPRHKGLFRVAIMCKSQETAREMDPLTHADLVISRIRHSFFGHARVSRCPSLFLFPKCDFRYSRAFFSLPSKFKVPCLDLGCVLIRQRRFLMRRMCQRDGFLSMERLSRARSRNFRMRALRPDSN